MDHKFRRLFLDIENSPNVGFFWKTGPKVSLDTENILTERRVICVCWKWEGESKVHSLTWDSHQDDRDLVRAIRDLLVEADEVVAHNGCRHDIPWLRARCLIHGFKAFPPVKLVDTLTIARSKFALNSYRLGYIAKLLKLDSKISTSFGLWKAVMRGEPLALRKMVRYCRRDVEVLEQVFRRVAPFAKPATHRGVIEKNPVWACPHCGSTNVRKSKTRVTASGALQHQMLCTDCGEYYTIPHAAFRKFEKATGRS